MASLSQNKYELIVANKVKINIERVRGIEPLASDWKSEVLPLYDTRTATLRYAVQALSYEQIYAR